MFNQQYQLIHRDTTQSEQTSQSVETSLFKSNLTGLYVFEQIQEGSGRETLYNAISLSAETLTKFLPVFQKITESHGPNSTTEVSVL